MNGYQKKTTDEIWSLKSAAVLLWQRIIVVPKNVVDGKTEWKLTR